MSGRRSRETRLSRTRSSRTRSRKAAAVLLGAWLAAAAALAPGAGRAGEPARATLHVDGMTCPSCSLAVRVALERLDGVSDARVSVAEKRATVSYDPGRVTPEDMARAVTRAGYPTRVASGDP